MIAEIAQWALVAGFTGIVMSIIVQFKALSTTQRKGKYGAMVIVALIFTTAAWIVQLAVLSMTS